MAKASKRIEDRRRRRFQRNLIVGGALGAVPILIGAYVLLNPAPLPPPSPIPTSNDFAVINTASGQIVFQIYTKEVPNTSQHFMQLFRNSYYNGLPWHRVENWVIQTGNGSPESTISLEINSTLHNDRGMVGVARSSDPNSGSSQFYILRSDSRGLDGQYAVFGKVVKGMDVVDRVGLNEVIANAYLTHSIP